MQTDNQDLLVYVSSHSISKILWDDIHFEDSSYNQWTAYGQSKTAASLGELGFDRKMKDKGIEVLRTQEVF